MNQFATNPAVVTKYRRNQTKSKREYTFGEKQGKQATTVEQKRTDTKVSSKRHRRDQQETENTNKR